MPERMENPCPKCILNWTCPKEKCKALAQFRLEDQMDVLVDLSEIEHVNGLQDAMDRATVHSETLTTDPEYTRKRAWHVHQVLNGIAVGILGADPWYRGYQLPPNYELVVNRFADAIQSNPPGDMWNGEVFRALSLLDIRDWVRKTAMEIPEFVAWNETDGSEMNFITRDSSVPLERQFIILEAVFQRVMCVLRNWARDEDRLEAKFEAEFGRSS
jgi:hypothetical protein